MEIIKKPEGKNIDEIAKLVFDEAIEILGGLRKLIEYRNLTWLPSLAESVYVVVLKEEGALTAKEIAEELGITSQTVNNIMRAKEIEDVEALLEPEEPINTHKAGAIAKLAYKNVKVRGIDESVVLDRGTADVLEILWSYNILRLIKGVRFPAGRDEIERRLRGIKVKGRVIDEILDRVEFPVRNPAHLIKEIKKHLE